MLTNFVGPDNEMVNVVGTISERWLERCQFGSPSGSSQSGSSQPQEDPELDSILKSCTIQLKLTNQYVGLQSGYFCLFQITKSSDLPSFVCMFFC
jgi:hypothetical protein